MQVAPREGPRAREQCPLCRAELAPGDAALVRCEACGTAVHGSCLQELSGGVCPVPGCQRTLKVAARQAPPPREAPGTSGWIVVLLVMGFAAVLAIAWLGTRYRIPSSVPVAAPKAAPKAPPWAAPPDTVGLLSHVRVGQRYTYELTAGLKEVLEVRGVSNDFVQYTSVVVLDGHDGVARGRAPEIRTWSLAGDRARGGELPGESIVIGGVRLQLMEQHIGRLVFVVPVRDGWQVFPPVVRQESDGKVSNRLVEVQEP